MGLRRPVGVPRLRVKRSTSRVHHAGVHAIRPVKSRLRVGLSLGAAALALVADVVSQLDGDTDLVPFFAILAVAAFVVAVAVGSPFQGRHRLVARAVTVGWAIAAVWIGALLVMYQVSCACSRAGPLAPEATYLGLPATAYHLAATYLGGALLLVATFGRSTRDARTGS